MKNILHILFGKPTFFYNPQMVKEDCGDVPVYSITVYKHWMGKNSISRIITNEDPIRLLGLVRIFVRTANE